MFSGGHTTLIPEATQIVFFIGKVPFSLHHCIRLEDINTNAKEQQIWSILRIKKSIEVGFVASGMEKGIIFLFSLYKLYSETEKLV